MSMSHGDARRAGERHGDRRQFHHHAAVQAVDDVGTTLRIDPGALSIGMIQKLSNDVDVCAAVMGALSQSVAEPLGVRMDRDVKPSKICWIRRLSSPAVR